METEKPHTFENWQPLIRRIACKYCKEYPIEDSEIYSELSWYFLKAVDNYDVNFNVKFMTFLWAALENQAKRFKIREYKRKKTINLTTDFTSLIDYTEGEIFIDDIQEEVNLEEIEKLITEREKIILEYKLEGLTLQEIGVKMGVSKQRIAMILNEIKNKLINSKIFRK